jgi:hypothetical protein
MFVASAGKFFFILAEDTKAAAPSTSPQTGKVVEFPLKKASTLEVVTSVIDWVPRSRFGLRC